MSSKHAFEGSPFPWGNTDVIIGDPTAPLSEDDESYDADDDRDKEDPLLSRPTCPTCGSPVRTDQQSTIYNKDEGHAEVSLCSSSHTGSPQVSNYQRSIVHNEDEGYDEAGLCSSPHALDPLVKSDLQRSVSDKEGGRDNVGSFPYHPTCPTCNSPIRSDQRETIVGQETSGSSIPGPLTHTTAPLRASIENTESSSDASVTDVEETSKALYSFIARVSTLSIDFIYQNFRTVRDHIYRITSTIAGFVWGVLVDMALVVEVIFGFMRWPLVILWSMLGLFYVSIWFSSTAISMSLASVCMMPGVSSLQIPFCDHPPSSLGLECLRDLRNEPVKFTELVEFQSTFESILGDAVGSSNIALDLKISVKAILDLRGLVGASDQLKDREVICDLLDKFIETAKITHRNLSKYGADVNGEVDHLLSLNKYMLRKIEDHKSDTGASFVSRWALAPFRPFYSNTLEAERDILDTFTRAATSIARGIDQLIMKGTEVLGNLDELNSRMIQLGNHFYVEEGALKKKNYEIQGRLWTALGMNRKKIAYYESHRLLLDRIMGLRDTAHGHVDASVVHLQDIESHLQQLQSRVMAATADSDARLHIMEVDIVAIQIGVDRLSDMLDMADRVKRAYKDEVLRLNAGKEKTATGS